MSSVTKTGVYLIGALGSISSTVVAGTLALKNKLVPTTGMVTSSQIFNGMDLLEPEDLAFGGCDIRAESSSSDIFLTMVPVAPAIVMAIKPGLEDFQREVDCGCARNCGEAIESLSGPANTTGGSLSRK